MSYERRLKLRIQKEWDFQGKDLTPGLCLRVFHKGKKLADLRMGQTYRFYDLASLTKIIFTVPVVMRLYSQKILKLNRPMVDYLSWFPCPQEPLGRVLNHSAGLPWWSPYFQQLQGPLEPHSRWRQLENYLRQIDCADISVSGRQSVYSDVDFLMLGMMLEQQFCSPLLSIWEKYKKSLGLVRNTLHFNPGNQPRYPRESYAPTEKCSWRKKILQGEVHDENTWALGGVAPHSGLFGSLNDVSQWGLLLRRSWLGKKDSVLVDQKTLHKFVRRSLPRSQGDWGYGFMLPTPHKASCGSYFSLTSFGHTGFTGTSLWYDPKRDLLVIILSNRVHPTRENKQFVVFRPLLHNFIVETLSESVKNKH